MLRSLYTIGISMAVPSGIKTIRAKLLNGVFDLVAKAPVINMKRFNGKYGCSTCTHPGSHSHGCHVYLPNIEPIPTARTHASIMLAAQEAEAKGVPVCGIKGTSVLASTKGASSRLRRLDKPLLPRLTLLMVFQSITCMQFSRE